MQMHFEIYQWLVPLICIFYLSRTLVQLAQNKRSLSSGLLWTVLWVTILVLAVIPNPVSMQIASLMGFKSNINAIIFVSLGWLFLLIFYLSSTLDRLERQLTILVRRIAISEAEKAGGDSSSAANATPDATLNWPKPEKRRYRSSNRPGKKPLQSRRAVSDSRRKL
jgi:hypothetical protein